MSTLLLTYITVKYDCIAKLGCKLYFLKYMMSVFLNRVICLLSNHKYIKINYVSRVFLKKLIQFTHVFVLIRRKLMHVIGLTPSY